MTFQPIPIITPYVTTNPVVVTTDSLTASIVAEGNTYTPAVEVRPSNITIAEAKPAEPNVT